MQPKKQHRGMTDVNTDTEELAVRAAQIASHRANRSPARKALLARLGPGLITGASDDDPSGIATYSQAGAQFGYAMSWTACSCSRKSGNVALICPC